MIALYMPVESKELFTWREENRRRRNTFSFGLHTDILVGVGTKWRRKARQNCGPLVVDYNWWSPCLFFLSLILATSKWR